MAVALAPRLVGPEEAGPTWPRDRGRRWWGIVDNTEAAEIPIDLGTGPFILDLACFGALALARTRRTAPDLLAPLVLRSVLACRSAHIDVVLVDLPSRRNGA